MPLGLCKVSQRNKLMEAVRFNLSGLDFLILELRTVRAGDSLSLFIYFKEEINDAAGRRGLGRGGIGCYFQDGFGCRHPWGLTIDEYSKRDINRFQRN